MKNQRKHFLQHILLSGLILCSQFHIPECKKIKTNTHNTKPKVNNVQPVHHPNPASLSYSNAHPVAQNVKPTNQHANSAQNSKPPIGWNVNHHNHQQQQPPVQQPPVQAVKAHPVATEHSHNPAPPPHVPYPSNPQSNIAPHNSAPPPGWNVNQQPQQHQSGYPQNPSYQNPQYGNPQQQQPFPNSQPTVVHHIVPANGQQSSGSSVLQNVAIGSAAGIAGGLAGAALFNAFNGNDDDKAKAIANTPPAVASVDSTTTAAAAAAAVTHADVVTSAVPSDSTTTIATTHVDAATSAPIIDVTSAGSVVVVNQEVKDNQENVTSIVETSSTPLIEVRNSAELQSFNPNKTDASANSSASLDVYKFLIALILVFAKVM